MRTSDRKAEGGPAGDRWGKWGIQCQHRHFRKRNYFSNEMQEGSKVPPTVEKMGVAVRIFPLVQFGKIGKAVGTVFACVLGGEKFSLGECIDNEGMQVTRLPKILC